MSQLSLSLSAGSAALAAVKNDSKMYGLTPKPRGSSSYLSSLSESLRLAGFGDGREIPHSREKASLLFMLLAAVKFKFRAA